MGKLDGKVAVVTGGARGIGESTVRRFVKEGARVVFGDILVPAGKALAKDLGKNARFVKHDVTVSAEWEQTVVEAEQAFGPINILVNDAGIYPILSFMDTSEEIFLKVLKTNALSVFLGIKAVVPSMRKTGSGGSIVNVSSISGLKGSTTTAYSASKWAIRGISRSAALEFAADQIRVNTVHPGIVATDIIPDAMRPMVTPYIPFKRLAMPEDISNMILFVASDEAKYSTGNEFVCDGGMTA